MAIKGVEVWLLCGYRVNANICIRTVYGSTNRTTAISAQSQPVQI